MCIFVIFICSNLSSPSSGRNDPFCLVDHFIPSTWQCAGSTVGAQKFFEDMMKSFSEFLLFAICSAKCWTCSWVQDGYCPSSQPRRGKTYSFVRQILWLVKYRIGDFREVFLEEEAHEIMLSNNLEPHNQWPVLGGSQTCHSFWTQFSWICL